MAAGYSCRSATPTLTAARPHILPANIRHSYRAVCTTQTAAKHSARVHSAPLTTCAKCAWPRITPTTAPLTHSLPTSSGPLASSLQGGSMHVNGATVCLSWKLPVYQRQRVHATTHPPSSKRSNSEPCRCCPRPGKARLCRSELAIWNKEESCNDARAVAVQVKLIKSSQGQAV